MKKIKHTCLLFATIAVISCNDFTTIAPTSQATLETSLRSESDFELAVNSVYSALMLNGNYGLNYILTQEMRADNADNGGGPTGLAATVEEIDTFSELPINDNIEVVWRDSYVGVNRANAILERIDDAQINEEVKNRIKGEALFLRSLYYYHLALTFGNIPLRLESTTSPNETLTQVSADEVFDQIISDLTQAEDLLPATFTGENVGRVTSGAAATLLAKTFLFTGDNQNAEQALRRIIDSNVYSLLDDFNNLWGAENENNAESIFEVQFRSGGTGTGSPYVDMYTPSPAGAGGGNAVQDVTDDIFNAFEEDDLRRDATIFFDDGDMFVKKYEGETFTELDSDLNFMVFRYADVLLMLAEAIGESEEAYDLINQVRDRAGLSPIDGSTPGSFEEKLLRERRVELAFENHRWYDLLRFGVAKSVMSEFLNLSESDITILYPIPQREIDVSNGNLVQNPEHVSR